MKNYVTTYDPFFDFFFPEVERKHSVSQMMDTDIKEKKDSYEMKVVLPEIKKEDIHISLEDGYLTIHATLNEEDDDSSFISRERRYGEFERSYYIGEQYDLSDLSANLESGVLRISIKKKEIKKANKEYLKIA